MTDQGSKPLGAPSWRGKTAMGLARRQFLEQMAIVRFQFAVLLVEFTVLLEQFQTRGLQLVEPCAQPGAFLTSLADGKACSVDATFQFVEQVMVVKQLAASRVSPHSVSVSQP